MQDFRTTRNRIEQSDSDAAASTDCIRFDRFNAEKMRFFESILSQTNGYMGIRGNFEERYSADHLQGTYLAGVWHPDKTRVGWWKNGYPEYFGKVINAVNFIGIRVLVNGEEINAGVQEVEEFHSALNLDTAVLSRMMVVKTASGRVKIESTRFLSIVEQQVAAIRYRATPMDESAEVVFIPYLDCDVRNQDANYDERFWELKAGEQTANGGSVYARTIENPFTPLRFDVCAAMNVVGSEPARKMFHETGLGYVSLSLQYHCAKGQTAQIDKLVSLSTSRDTARVKRDAQDVLLRASEQGFDKLLAAHCEKMASLLETCKIELEGNPQAEQGIRYNLLQLLCTYRGQDSRLNIGPKGFSGEKYGGAAYWDTEAFLIPFYLGIADASVAKNLLLFRYQTLPQAMENARKLGLSGALYPMVTFDGRECHNEWEITFEEIHRNGAIAYAIFNYVSYTNDTDYLTQFGFPVLLEQSRFWVSRAHESARTNSYVIHGVTGPNEYENNVNNNWYTNRIAKWTLEYTVSVMEAFADRLDNRVGEAEKRHFSEVAERMYLPYDSERRVFVQHDGFLDKELRPASGLDPAQRPISHHWSWDRILRSCYIKQADVLQGMFLLEDTFSGDVIRRNFGFYEPMTVHESSLSAGVHSVIASWCQQPDQAWELFLRTVRLDLDDVNHDTADGLHITAMSGGWLAVVKGFAGMRTASGTLRFAPVLPRQLKRYQFAVQYQKRVIRLSVDAAGVTITLQSGDPLTLTVYEREYRLESSIHVPFGQPAQGRNTKALIFDLDGVLTDTARLHYEAWRALAKEEWNFTFTQEMNERFKGVERRACMRILAQLMRLEMPEEQIVFYADQKNAFYKKLLLSITPDDLMPKTRNLLNTCREQGFLTAVASASRNTKEILRRTGILDLFDTIVDGSDVERPKPDPACFLEAAARLGVSPGECLVIEDSQSAIDGAAQAGFACVGVGKTKLNQVRFQLSTVSDLDLTAIE